MFFIVFTSTESRYEDSNLSLIENLIEQRFSKLDNDASHSERVRPVDELKAANEHKKDVEQDENSIEKEVETEVEGETKASEQDTSSEGEHNFEVS